MAQKTVKQFFQARKRIESGSALHPSKRAKLNEPSALDPIGPSTPVLTTASALTTASVDDHDRPLNENSAQTNDPKASRKRTRVQCTESEGLKMPEKGYDFSAFTSDDKLSECKVTRRRILKKANAVAKCEKETESDAVIEVSIGKNEVVLPEANAGVSEKKSEDKNVDADTMKMKLATCGNLTDLKEILSRIGRTKAMQNKNAAEKLNLSELRDRLKRHGENKARLQQLKESVQESQNQDKVDKSSDDDKRQTKAAHERFRSLAEPLAPTLSLPTSYSALLEMFRCSDNVVSWLDNRAEICTFDKLRKAVEHATRKSFELRHLGQFKTVYPTAYLFRQEKDLPCVGGKISGYQLTIEANLEEFSEPQISEKKTSLKEKILFTAAKLVERRNRFHQNLVSFVLRFHEEFLSRLKIPLKVAADKLTRWHPKFNLEEVLEIEPSPLPEKPEERKITTASEALQLHKEKFDLRVQRALEIVAKKRSAESSVDPAAVRSSEGKTAPSAKTANEVNDRKETAAVKGIPQSLLERIRAKEAKVAQSHMQQTPEEQLQLERLRRVPELIRILRTYFVGQKRPAIPVADAVQAFSSSYKSFLGPVEAEHHLRLIARVVPQWMQVVRVSKGEYVKLDGKMELATVVREVEKQIADMQCKSTPA